MQKSPSPCVFDPRNGLVMFMNTLRTLLESFGPKLPCENLFHGNRMPRTNYFLHSLQSFTFQNCSKLHFFHWKILQNGFLEASKSKNRHLRTLVLIKIDSRIVRPPRLFLRIPMDPKMCLKANFDF